MKKRGVLVMAYGAPDSMEDIEPFYTDIRGGRPPSTELLQELIERYEAIGGKSPLLDITARQASALEAQLGSDAFTAYVGMRHWKPSIPDTLRVMAEDGIEDAVAVVMAPHYSRMSIGKYLDIVDQALTEHASGITMHKVQQWHLEPAFIHALEHRVHSAMKRFSADEQTSLRVLFTAHSLPERIREWNDPYPDQLLETSRKIAGDLQIKNWQFAYQSSGRTPEPWLGPDIIDVIDRSAEEGIEAILVCVVGFVSDHLEVLYDIDVEAKPAAEAKGLHLERIDMLNDDPGLIEALAGVVNDAWEC
jgi:ferrochelatase